MKLKKRSIAMALVAFFISSILILPQTAKASTLQYYSNDGWWKSDIGSFNANNITGRVVAGDFDGDGKKDIAALYDLGNNTSRIYVFKSTGSSFTHEDSFDWVSGSGDFDANRVKGMAAGDFDGDGHDDIAILYDLGNSTSRIYVFKSTGSSFTHEDSFDWVSGSGSFDANSVKGMVAGNFTGTNKTDIALFYDLGNRTSRIFVFKSTGSSFTHEDSADWTSGSGSFNADNVKGIVSGNFQGKDKPAGIAAFFDLGNNTTTMFVWVPSGGTLTHEDNFDWTSGSGSFNANNITGRIAAGNFTGSNNDDIVMFYDCGNTSTRMMVFKSTGSSFTHDDDYDWQTGNSYDANKLTGRVVAGDFNGDSKADVAGFYDYDNATTRIHVWLTNGASDAQRLVNIAIKEAQDGNEEGSGGWTKYGEWYGSPYAQWCAMFVSWCANQAGISTDVISKTASCADHTKCGTWHDAEKGYVPKPGDIVFFYDYMYEHEGIVESIESKDGLKIHTIEGNCNNKVCRMVRYEKTPYTMGYIKGYVTPNYRN